MFPLLSIYSLLYLLYFIHIKFFTLRPNQAHQYSFLHYFVGDIMATLSFEKLENPQVGDICAVKYSVDNLYYRARILSTAPEGGWNVQFIDYGNPDIAHEFQALPKNVQELPAFAVHCKLADTPILDGCSRRQQLFNDLVMKIDWFNIEMVEKNENQTTVNLFSDGKNLLDMIDAELKLTDEPTNSEGNQEDVTEQATENAVEGLTRDNANVDIAEPDNNGPATRSVAVEDVTESKDNELVLQPQEVVAAETCDEQVDEPVKENFLPTTIAESFNEEDVGEPTQENVAESNNEPAIESVVVEDVTEPKDNELVLQPQVAVNAETCDEQVTEPKNDESANGNVVVEDVTKPKNDEPAEENVSSPTNGEPVHQNVHDRAQQNVVESANGEAVKETVSMVDFFNKYK
jgi:hypothetical protein